LILHPSLDFEYTSPNVTSDTARGIYWVQGRSSSRPQQYFSACSSRKGSYVTPKRLPFLTHFGGRSNFLRDSRGRTTPPRPCVYPNSDGSDIRGPRKSRLSAQIVTHVTDGMARPVRPTDDFPQADVHFAIRTSSCRFFRVRFCRNLLGLSAQVRGSERGFPRLRPHRGTRPGGESHPTRHLPPFEVLGP
jgi:hypothetical protein